MYKLLIICFIVLISIFYFIYYRNEGFTDQIKSNKNLFINNGKPIEIDDINVNNICIEDGGETTCISKEQLFNTLNLPIFRKHSICIEDACITRNNLKKIKGENDINLKTKDEKCAELSKIPGTFSIRNQASWETDRHGIKGGDNEAKIYHSLYEPEGGWVKEKKCGMRRRRCPGEAKGSRKWCYEDYNYGGKIPDNHEAIMEYGCARKHSRSPGVCWASAGGKCTRERNQRRRTRKTFYPNKTYIPEVNKEGQGNDTMYDLDNIEGHIPSLKQNIDCTKPDTKFNVTVGDVINNFDILNNPMKAFNYKSVAKHDKHDWE
jgi:hypothetical protein